MRGLSTATVTIALVLVSLVAHMNSVRAQAPTGAFVDEVIFLEQGRVGAVQQVSAGKEMQMYLDYLRTPADKRAALEDPNIWAVQVPIQALDLFVNPVQFANPEPGVSPYNIFAHRDIRVALNWLVDRDFIVEQMLEGFARPYIAPWHSRMPEYVREVVHFQKLEKMYAYDPLRAKETIFRVLSDIPGMEFQVDGKWYYQGTPLTIRFVIRSDDIRTDIGNFIADRIEEALGITVFRDYEPLSAAFACVYDGDPSKGCWSIYTEGFAFTEPINWDDTWIASFYTLFGGETIWKFYSPPGALSQAAFRLLKGQYSSPAERQELIRAASELAVQDGVRVWLASEESLFLFNNVIEAAVTDLWAGSWSVFTLRTARYAEVGGTLKIGQPFLFNSPWNPVRGFTSRYDKTMFETFADPGVSRHPHTGNRIEVRAPYTVETAGPSGQLDVDPAAQVWETPTSRWTSVPAGAKAVSKVTFDYTFGKWHDGSDMSMDDILVTLSHYFRLQNGDAINPYTGTPYTAGDLGLIDARGDSPGINFYMGLFKGIRVVDADTAEIYLDYWHVESAEIVAVASLWPTEPWTAWELMAKAVLDNEARYNAFSASTGNCPGGCVVLDLGRGASLGFMNADVVTLRAANHIPAGFSTIITSGEAQGRWAGMDDFRQAYGHFYVSNGPFYVEKIDAANEQAIMKRVADYPFTADTWDAMLQPRVPRVAVGDVTTPGANPGEVVPGLPLTVQIQAAVGGQPYSQVAFDYLVVNPATGEVIASGKPTPTGTMGTWEVSFSREQTSALLPGTYELRVIGVGEEAAIPISTTKTFVTIPQLVFFERLIGQVTAQLGTLQSDLDAIQAGIDTVAEQAGALSRLLSSVLILAVVGLSIAVLAVPLALLRARRRGTRAWMERLRPPA